MLNYALFIFACITLPLTIFFVQPPILTWVLITILCAALFYGFYCLELESRITLFKNKLVLKRGIREAWMWEYFPRRRTELSLRDITGLEPQVTWLSPHFIIFKPCLELRIQLENSAGKGKATTTTILFPMRFFRALEQALTPERFREVLDNTDLKEKIASEIQNDGKFRKLVVDHFHGESQDKTDREFMEALAFLLGEELNELVDQAVAVDKQSLCFSFVNEGAWEWYSKEFLTQAKRFLPVICLFLFCFTILASLLTGELQELSPENLFPLAGLLVVVHVSSMLLLYLITVHSSYQENLTVHRSAIHRVMKRKGTVIKSEFFRFGPDITALEHEVSGALEIRGGLWSFLIFPKEPREKVREQIENWKREFEELLEESGSSPDKKLEGVKENKA